MDGSSVEHSDSDSGESWTMLERGPGDCSPTHADRAPDFPDTPTRRPGESADQCHTDDDTDGISIISESDNEFTNYELVQSVIEAPAREEPPADPSIPPDYLDTPRHANNSNENHEPIKDPDDMLGDGPAKMKTYVHRRNQRLSTVLNIIVLGSVITAAGVAIGHMWGVRDDCSLQGTQSVNKILSNLYKLQEENAYLRSKLKELTLINNFQVLQRRSLVDVRPSPKQRCKKVFEESLTSRNVGRATKCVDFDSANSFKDMEAHLVQPGFEKEFVSDVNKLKNVYQQNKSWLDEEIAARLETESVNLKAFKDKMNENRTLKSSKALKDKNSEAQLEFSAPLKLAEVAPGEYNPTEDARKITYAESLVSNKDLGNRRKRSIQGSDSKDRPKRKLKKINETHVSDSDEEFTKDDRYAGRKHPKDTRKREKQKNHRREKRRNKYQQWEMKGGYIKDYDDISLSSEDFEPQNTPKDTYKEKPKDKHQNKPKEAGNKKRKSEGRLKDKSVETDPAWFEARAAQRDSARRRLEWQLFSQPSSASWYFRRVKRREAGRLGRGANATNKRAAKPDMNFKSKR